jgi:MoaA/NifB/PqqE/SkfB family radical SAM enzyme
MELIKQTIGKLMKKEKDDPPGFCCIGITDYCFFRCKMCDKWKEDISIDKRFSKPPELPDWKRFIYQLSKVIPKDKLAGNMDQRFEINFAGGESLTHPLTLPLVHYASSLGFRTVIPSNGFLINEEMAKKLADARLSAINLSLDSLNPDIHDKFRGKKGAYKGVMKAIDILKRYKYPETGIIAIIHEETYPGMIDLVKWVCDNKDLKWILTMAIMQPNNTIFESGWYERQEYSDLFPKDREKVLEVVDELIRIKDHQINLRKQGLIRSDKLVNTMHQLKAFRQYFADPETFVKNEMSCNFDTALQVSAVGDIYMCYHFEKLGNVMKDDFRTAWSSTKAKDIRKQILSCKTNCHELINCYFENEYPFSKR